MDLMKMGAFLKELRKEKNITQEQLAEKMGVYPILEELGLDLIKDAKEAYPR